MTFATTDFPALGAAHTAREIAQQSDCWQQIPALLAATDPAIRQAVAQSLKRAGDAVIFSGAGTSAYVGEILAPALSRHAAAFCLARHSTDVVSDPAACVPRGARGVFFAFARSGNSPESLDSLEKLQAVAPEVMPVYVTCNPEGALAKKAAAGEGLSCLMPEETHDQSFVMTSSFSTMTLFTAALCREALGLPTLDVDGAATAADRIVADFYTSGAMDDLAQAKRLVFLGSNALWGAARESALKILEMTAGAIPTMAETALGFRHGPKSLMDKETAVMVFASNDAYTQQFDRDIAVEVLNGSARNVFIVGSPAFFARYPELAAHGLPHVPDGAPDEVLAVLAVLHAQLLGLRLAIDRGIAADNPCPSGEVNRVVQGVKLYPYP
ncbi:MAG: SIS domain-containing protein [Cardiobacteriaceae bacterium]|nr:SIS domain-containing protein [Cardiobacteriaceae bacterium]